MKPQPPKSFSETHPHIYTAEPCFKTHHPEWQWKCYSYSKQGFLHLVYGSTIEEAYQKWSIHKPYWPEVRHV